MAVLRSSERILILLFLHHMYIARIFRAVAGDCRLAAPTDFYMGISVTGNWTCLDSFSCTYDSCSRSRIDERGSL